MKLSGTVLVFGALILCFAGLLSVSPAAWASEQQVQYFPQLGDGGGYATTWYFTGLGFGSNIVTVELFDKSGHPLMLATDMGTSSIFRFTLDGSGSASLRTLSAGNSVKTGWAKVTSSQPVGATEIFKYIGNNGGITCQAAVLPSDPIEVATLLASDPRTTALAILNAGATTTAIDFQLMDGSGNPVGSTSTLSLPPYNQVALYVNQIPGFENASALNGSLEISGPSPFSLVTLLFEGQSFSTAPVLPGRPGLSGYRSSLLNDINGLMQQLANKQDDFLAPAPEDLASFADFLSQPQTGLIRLLPRETYDGHLTIRGGGAYYSFARLTHEYGDGSDIGLEQGYLSVGFAGADFGFLTSLGNMPIDRVTLDDPAVQYLASFAAPTNLSDARVQQQRAGAGFSIGSYSYIDRMKATQNTYVLRSICYGTSDLLVAFQVTRFDTDGSAILVWKLLKSFPVPQLQ